MGLVQAYEVAFKKYNILTAQMLLTHEDLSNRERYLNAKNTLNNLIKFNSIPIIMRMILLLLRKLNLVIMIL